MNHVLNDQGETVIAVGAPGSVERAECEHPEFIKSLSETCRTESSSSGLGRVDSAAVIASQLHKRGILSEQETTALLTAAGFRKENCREVFEQLKLMHQDRDRELMGAVRPVHPGPSSEQKHSPEM